MKNWLQKFPFRNWSNWSPRSGKIFIVPTWSGLSALVAGVFMLWGGALYSNNSLLLYCFIWLFVVTLILVMTHQNLRGVSAPWVEVADSFAGESLAWRLVHDGSSGQRHWEVRVSWQQRQGARPSSRVHRDLGEWRDPKEALEVSTDSPMRGSYQVTSVRMATRYPFGLFYAWIQWQVASEFFVFPEPVGTNSPPPSNDLSLEQGKFVDPLQNEDWHSHRPYRPGDSPRRVDWLAFARSGELVTRTYVGLQSPRSEVHWRNLSGGTEAKLSQLSRWAVSVQKGGLAMDLHWPEGGWQGPVENRADAKRLLRILAQYPSASSASDLQSSNTTSSQTASREMAI